MNKLYIPIYGELLLLEKDWEVKYRDNSPTFSKIIIPRDSIISLGVISNRSSSDLTCVIS